MTLDEKGEREFKNLPVVHVSVVLVQVGDALRCIIQKGEGPQISYSKTHEETFEEFWKGITREVMGVVGHE